MAKLKDFILNKSTEAALRRLNVGLSICVIFLITFLVLVLFTTKNDAKKAYQTSENIKMAVMLPHIQEPIVATNIPTVSNGTSQVSPINPNYIQHPDEYSINDIVVINHYNITGVIIGRMFPSGDVYRILYNDNNRELHIIDLPKSFFGKLTIPVLLP